MEILEEVRQIGLPLGQYVVFGSGILAAKGIRPAKDIDLLVTDGLFKQLKAKGWKRKYLFKRVFTCKLLVNGKVEAFSNANHRSYRRSVDDLVRTAEIIDGIPFMNIHELKDFKQALARPKDLKDIALIDEYLRNHPSC